MKSFLFEFFRSRFRRKSLKKFGDLNTDGVLFEFKGEIAESTSIENILERQLRQAEFLGQTDEISRISDTLNVLRSRPSQLTAEQCEDIKIILRQQKQSLIEASDAFQQSLKVNAFFDNQGFISKVD